MMNGKKKKLLSAVLALSMVLTLMPPTAWAAGGGGTAAGISIGGTTLTDGYYVADTDAVVKRVDSQPAGGTGYLYYDASAGKLTVHGKVVLTGAGEGMSLTGSGITLDTGTRETDSLTFTKTAGVAVLSDSSGSSSGSTLTLTGGGALTLQHKKDTAAVSGAVSLRTDAFTGDISIGSAGSGAVSVSNNSSVNLITTGTLTLTGNGIGSSVVSAKDVTLKGSSVSLTNAGQGLLCIAWNNSISISSAEDLNLTGSYFGPLLVAEEGSGVVTLSSDKAVKVENRRNSGAIAVKGSLSIPKATDVSLTSAGGITITGNAEITSDGAVSIIASDSGSAVVGNLTVHNATSVNATNNSNSSATIYGNADITASGKVNVQNYAGMAANTFTVTNAPTVTISGNPSSGPVVGSSVFNGCGEVTITNLNEGASSAASSVDGDTPAKVKIGNVDKGMQYGNDIYAYDGTSNTVSSLSVDENITKNTAYKVEDGGWILWKPDVKPEISSTYLASGTLTLARAKMTGDLQLPNCYGNDSKEITVQLRGTNSVKTLDDSIGIGYKANNVTVAGRENSADSLTVDSYIKLISDLTVHNAELNVGKWSDVKSSNSFSIKLGHWEETTAIHKLTLTNADLTLASDIWIYGDTNTAFADVFSKNDGSFVASSAEGQTVAVRFIKKESSVAVTVLQSYDTDGNKLAPDITNGNLVIDSTCTEKTTYKAGSGTVVWEPTLTGSTVTGGTLKLQNASMEAGSSIKVTADVPVTVVAEGTNQIYQLGTKGTLTLTGNGILTAELSSWATVSTGGFNGELNAVVTKETDREDYLTVHGNATADDMYVGAVEGNDLRWLTIPQGTTLTIPQDITLGINGTQYVENHGTIINNGVIWLVMEDPTNAAAVKEAIGSLGTITGTGKIAALTQSDFEENEFADAVYYTISGTRVHTYEEGMDFTEEAADGNWSENATLDNDGYHWDKTTQTLTIQDLSILTTEEFDTPLSLPSGSTLIVKGSNRLSAASMSDDGEQAMPIEVELESSYNSSNNEETPLYPDTVLIIQGDGTLDVSDHNGMIDASQLTVTGDVSVTVGYHMTEKTENPFLTVSGDAKLTVLKYGIQNVGTFTVTDHAQADITSVPYTNGEDSPAAYPAVMADKIVLGSGRSILIPDGGTVGSFEMQYGENPESTANVATIFPTGAEQKMENAAMHVVIGDTPVKQSLADAVVTLNATEFTYNGMVQIPAVTVKLGEVTLDSNQYTVSFMDDKGAETASPTKAGTYTVTVTAGSSGKYTGTAASRPTYTIKPAKLYPVSELKEGDTLYAGDKLLLASASDASGEVSSPSDATPSDATASDISIEYYDADENADFTELQKDAAVIADTIRKGVTYTIKTWKDTVRKVTFTIWHILKLENADGTEDGRILLVHNPVWEISFDAGEGSCDTDSKYTDENGYLTMLPTAERSGYTFDGWYTEAERGEKVTEQDAFGEDTTLYAHWTDNTARPDNTDDSDDSDSDNNSAGNSGNESGNWVQQGTRWQFIRSDGTTAADTWVKTGDRWYHFDSKGYAQTGWVLDNGKWYHCDPKSYAMDTGWYQSTEDGNWYYLNPDGSMAVGWVQVNKKWYYFNPYPTGATYIYDPETETWKWNGAATLPYGAMLKNTTTPDRQRVDENGVRID